jgi:hypothetical protein
MLPSQTRLWAALVQASGGIWGGCVYDTDAIVARLQAPQTNTSPNPILEKETR